MAQNYDPATGIALMGACDPSCRFPCVPTCPLDPERSVSARFGPAGLEIDMSDSWSAFTCNCNRTDQHPASECRAFDDAQDAITFGA